MGLHTQPAAPRATTDVPPDEVRHSLSFYSLSVCDCVVVFLFYPRVLCNDVVSITLGLKLIWGERVACEH